MPGSCDEDNYSSSSTSKTNNNRRSSDEEGFHLRKRLFSLVAGAGHQRSYIGQSMKNVTSSSLRHVAGGVPGETRHQEQLIG